MSIGIYKITSPSGKIYIGQSINIEHRFKHYRNLKEIKRQKKIYYSIRKYGYDNHVFEIIEKCNSNELNSKEIYWINFYKSNILGLNICEGGNSLGKLNKGKKRLEETKKKISNTKLKNPRNLTDELILHYRNTSTNIKEIFQYSLEGEFINKFISINEAARQLGIRNDGISACLRKKQLSSYGYQWFYTLQTKVEAIKKSSKPDKWVGNRNINIDSKINEILEIYMQGKNITQIAKIFKVHRDVIKKRIKDNINK